MRRAFTAVSVLVVLLILGSPGFSVAMVNPSDSTSATIGVLAEDANPVSEDDPRRMKEPYLENENRMLLSITSSSLSVKADSPGDDDIAHNMTTRPIAVEGIIGIELITRDRKVLRRLLDTNGDNKFDQWISFRDGKEAFRYSDTDFDGKADIAVIPLPKDEKPLTADAPKETLN